jgi:hypothetical protein
MKPLVQVFSYCVVAGGLLPVLLGALPEVAQPVMPRSLPLRYGEGTEYRVAAPAVSPKFSRQGRFELLPNWEVGRVATQLLPNYETGMASFELLAHPELATVSRTPAFTPIAPSRQASGESDD